jgi:polygalacturonase
MSEIKDCTFTGKQEGIKIFNVKDFGAKGDQVTDDRRALQRAFNAANLAQGGRVYWPPGKYYASRPARIDGSWWVRLWLWLQSWWKR